MTQIVEINAKPSRDMPGPVRGLYIYEFIEGAQQFSHAWRNPLKPLEEPVVMIPL